jgi:hypothetical protein
LRDQKADRHHLNAVVFHRLHVLSVHAFRPAFDAHHHRLTRAVDIGIEQANAGAFCGQCQGQIHRSRAFADTALARRHGDDVLHIRQQLHTALHAVAGDFEADVDRHIAHAADGLGRGDQHLAQAGDLAFGRVTQLDIERHISPADLQVFKRFGADEILAGIRVGDGHERVEYLLLRGHA